MNIAFDAKRIYQNRTGLGNYSRTLVNSLSQYFPEHAYFLCAPKITSLFNENDFHNIHTITPNNFPSKCLKGLWRSNLVKKDLINANMDIYHGLSHEIPFGIQRTKIKSVVTIHDLIFERYPSQYNAIDVFIYRRKFINACKNADRIIAISEQTKKDIVEFYKIDEKKITICYQSCQPSFYTEVDNNDKKRIKEKYNLPDNFFLFVGSIIERKNLLTICKAIKLLSAENSLPLVVIGDGKEYLHTVKEYLTDNQLNNRVIFLKEYKSTDNKTDYLSINDFPAIYQLATALIYPSIFEGFGIPILEALASKTPVITSNISCMPEVGGNAAYYVNPLNPEEIANAMTALIQNTTLAKQMKTDGAIQANKFNALNCANAVMNVYKSL